MNGVATSSKIGSSPRTGADEDYAEDRRDEQAMVGGFAIFLLMTKVPGERISNTTCSGMRLGRTSRAPRLAATDDSIARCILAQPQAMNKLALHDTRNVHPWCLLCK